MDTGRSRRGKSMPGSGLIRTWPSSARADAVLVYRNQSFNTYGILNVREAFAKRYPELGRRVLAVMSGRASTLFPIRTNSAAELVDAAGVSPEVAHIQLSERTELSMPAIGSEHRATFISTGEVLRRIGFIDASVDIGATLDSWIEASYLGSAG